MSADIIGVVGQPLSGKDTVVQVLIDHGYAHISTGDLLREYIKEHDLGQLTRPVIREVANRLRAEQGADYLVRIALEQAGGRVAVSGIRTVAEAETLKAAGGQLVWVEAPEALRFARLTGRSRTGDDLTLEEFRQQEGAETASSNPNEQNVSALEALADVSITNDVDLEALRALVERDVLGT